MAGIGNAGTFTKVGLMMRSGVGATDPFVFLHFQPNNGGVTVGTRASSTQTQAVFANVGGPQPWLKEPTRRRRWRR